MAQHDQKQEDDYSGAILAPERPKLEPPHQYKVILLNDDFTPMEFVVEVLVGIFSHPPAMAVEIMLAIHKQGRGVAGVFTRDIAETKIGHVHEMARVQQHPLRCTMEQA